MPGIDGIEQVQADLHELTQQWLAYFQDPFPDQHQLADLVESDDLAPIARLRDLCPGPRGPQPH